MDLLPHPLRAPLPLLAVVLLLLPSPAAWADDAADEDPFPGEFTANVGFATDYPFRGISQTDEHGAIQGGIDWGWAINDSVGVYAGGWGSNVDFGDGDEAQVEIDIYGGVSGSLGGFSWDLTAIYYAYPGARSSLDYAFWDFGPTLGYDFGVASVSATYLWSPEYFGHSGDSHWITGGVEVPVPEDGLPSWLGAGFSANVGHQAIDDDETFGVRDYLTWDIGTTVSAFGLDVDVRYYDTDVSKGGCFGGSDLCGDRVVALVSKSF